MAEGEAWAVTIGGVDCPEWGEGYVEEFSQAWFDRPIATGEMCEQPVHCRTGHEWNIWISVSPATSDRCTCAPVAIAIRMGNRVISSFDP
jgi:hypothetical protein